jgi:hypothetical protein
VHPARPSDHESAERLAPRTRRRPGQSAVPQPHRPSPHPRRRLAAGDQTRRHRQRTPSLTPSEERQPTHAASHGGDVATQRTDPGRHRDDRCSGSDTNRSTPPTSTSTPT